MSPANRGSRWANSGLVVELHPEDIPATGIKVEDPTSPLALMQWCEAFEHKSYLAANRFAPCTCSAYDGLHRTPPFVHAALVIPIRWGLPRATCTSGCPTSSHAVCRLASVPSTARHVASSRAKLSLSVGITYLLARAWSPVTALPMRTPSSQASILAGEGAGFAGGGRPRRLSMERMLLSRSLSPSAGSSPLHRAPHFVFVPLLPAFVAGGRALLALDFGS